MPKKEVAAKLAVLSIRNYADAPFLKQHQCRDSRVFIGRNVSSTYAAPQVQGVLYASFFGRRLNLWYFGEGFENCIDLVSLKKFTHMIYDFIDKK